MRVAAGLIFASAVLVAASSAKEAAKLEQHAAAKAATKKAEATAAQAKPKAAAPAVAHKKAAAVNKVVQSSAKAVRFREAAHALLKKGQAKKKTATAAKNMAFMAGSEGEKPQIVQGPPITFGGFPTPLGGWGGASMYGTGQVSCRESRANKAAEHWGRSRANVL